MSSFLERSVPVLVAKHDPIMTTRSKYATMMVNCNGDKCKLKPWNQSPIGIHLLSLHGSTMFEYKQTWPQVFLQFLSTFILNWQIIFYHIHAQHIQLTWHSKRPHWMSASFFFGCQNIFHAPTFRICQQGYCQQRDLTWNHIELSFTKHT
jgi:hypothetical protein